MNGDVAVVPPPVGGNIDALLHHMMENRAGPAVQRIHRNQEGDADAEFRRDIERRVRNIENALRPNTSWWGSLKSWACNLMLLRIGYQAGKTILNLSQALWDLILAWTVGSTCLEIVTAAGLVKIIVTVTVIIVVTTTAYYIITK